MDGSPERGKSPPTQGVVDGRGGNTVLLYLIPVRRDPVITQQGEWERRLMRALPLVTGYASPPPFTMAKGGKGESEENINVQNL